jgi:hypothetical protein
MLSSIDNNKYIATKKLLFDIILHSKLLKFIVTLSTWYSTNDLLISIADIKKLLFKNGLNILFLYDLKNFDKSESTINEQKGIAPLENDYETLSLL